MAEPFSDFDLEGFQRPAYVAAPSGLLLPERIAEALIRRAQRPKAVDLFAGCGGMSLGMIQGGWKVVAAVEYDCDAVMTYMTNLCRWGEVQVHHIEPADRGRMECAIAAEYKRAGVILKDGQIQFDGKTSWKRVPIAGSGLIAHEPGMPSVRHIFIGDIRKLSGERLLRTIGMQAGELGCVTGGPPCQGFSTLGKRNVMDPRNSLIFEFARLVCELRPGTMVMENVPGILTMVTPDGVPVVDAFARILEDGGFGQYERFIQAMKAQGAVGLVRGAGRDGEGRKSRRRRKREAGTTQEAGAPS